MALMEGAAVSSLVASEHWRTVSSLATFVALMEGAAVSSLVTVLFVLATTRGFLFLATLVAVADLLEGGNLFLLPGAVLVAALVAPEIGELVATLFLMRADARLGLASTSCVPPLDVGDMVMQYL